MPLSDMTEPHTPGLSAHGYIAVVEVAVYTIALVISVINCVRYDFKRQTGWVYLSIFCICRIVASALTIVVEESSDPSTGMITAEMIVSNIALTPLHLAALGLLTTSTRLTLADTMSKVFTKLLRFCRLALSVAIVLGIVGGVELAKDGTSQTGHTLSRVSVILITVAFAILMSLSLFFLRFATLQPHNRMLILGVTVALPFLLVRIIYSICYAFSSSTMSKFSTLTGDWKIYLGMDVIMEFVVLAVLTTTGFLLQNYSRKKGIAQVEQGSPYEMAYVRDQEMVNSDLDGMSK
ncbi:hypothetical protein V1520DRAFT_295553 [Lipomyces starkeyi]